MNNKKICKYLTIFFIGAFVGFIYEVIFYYITENRLDNAGILFGPWLPIYGFGALFISLIPKKIKKNPFILFITIMLVTGILEYIVGWIDLKFFNIRLWDYRGLVLNIDGFVCLRSVLTFAIGGIILTYTIIPTIDKILENKKYYKIIYSTILVVSFIFCIDFILSKILDHTPYLY